MNERIEQFGFSPSTQNELAALIFAGQKRATTSLARWYGDDGLPWPVVGETWVVADGQGLPCCRCRTTHVEVRAFRSVDAAHAAAEGEEDGSLARWRAIHLAFFEQEAARDGFSFEEDALVVLEQFKMVQTL